MPQVSLLFIDDHVVGPHLQLLRQICEPTSTSRPHVTVRYFERLQIPDEYRDTSVSHIDLMEPGMFRPLPNGFGQPTHVETQTVFIRCRSDDLAPLEHKPDFPGSDFHITVYDGPSQKFARSVLRELQRFRWRLRVRLPSQARLTVKEVKPQNRRRRATEPVYGAEIRELFRSVAQRELNWRYLVELSDRERLRLCRSVLEDLFHPAHDFERVRAQRSRLTKDRTPDSADPELPEVHLTPPELAREITQYVLKSLENTNEPIDFGDPAVGTGAFFSALTQLIPKQRLRSAIGIDINADQVAAARWRWGDKGMRVLKGDYLHMDRLSKRTLVLANPPYLRHQSIPRPYKERLRDRASIRTDIHVSARSGLYVYFLLLSHDWMREGAVAGWLIPGEFMRAAYGSAVRRYLTEKVELLRIHDFGQKVPQFENVTASPVVVVFRKRQPRMDQTVCMTVGGGLTEPHFKEAVSLADLRDAHTWKVPLYRETAAEIAQFRIGDLFTVRRGIATGANSFFIMTRKNARARGIPKSALKPVLPKVRTLSTDIIEAEHDGYPLVSPQLCVLDCDLPEEVIRRRYPRLMDYLNSAKSLGIRNRRLLKDHHPWYKQERRAPPPFLCTYMGRGSDGKPPLRFIWNKSQAIATNTYLLLYPKPTLEKILLHNPAAGAQLFSLLQRAATKGLSQNSRVQAGGLHKIEPGELLNAKLPIPSTFGLEGVEEQLELFR